MTIRKQIDLKHTIEYSTDIGLQILKSSNNIPIPDNEPLFLFRGRDRLALPMLEYYRELCYKDGCTDYQLNSMDEIIRRFDTFSKYSNTMKQPGITLGK